MASTTWRNPFEEKKEVYKANPKSLDGVPDLCMLTYLGEENVLYNLNFRYKQSHCYTSTTAKVLVAVNPYERMDHNYTEKVMAQYQAAEINLEGLADEKSLPPHVFAVANAAFVNLCAKKQNQSIIVCGESGSGKTESAKYQMRFLAFTTTSTSADPSEFASADKIGQQVLDANPILESFGNAKTLLNNNSSRFGKFTKLLFEEVKGAKARRRLIGAAIETYLLEKSRVVRQDKGERNFHIFYQLTTVYGDIPNLNLGPSEQFHYVNQSGVNSLDDLRFPGKAADSEWFKELTHAFKTLSVPEETVNNVYRIVAGVLHTGNIGFEQQKGEGSDIKNPDSLNQAAALFEVPVPSFTKRLQTRSILLPGDKLLVKPLNQEDAYFNRDSLSRNVYNGLFRWIVNLINSKSNAQEGPTVLWIGILDVFGFEIFEHNSFEQFCINFCNERLQQYFNEHVLKAEQDLYKREALLWDPIDLPDNQDCIDLVMGKPYGIVPILDSTCVQPKGTDLVFTANLFKAHKYHPRLRQITQHKKSESDKQFTQLNGFVIRHYAGAVLYDCAEFLVKNADASEFDSVECFMESKSSITQEILRVQANGTVVDAKRSAKRAFLSTGTVFIEQLNSLMATLKATAPYFVRCIKPNPNKAAKQFEGEYVRPQLRCGGLIEALRIIKLGFPTRCAYKRVHELFAPILKDKPITNLNMRDFTEGLLAYVGNPAQRPAKGEYQLGLSMIFFRPGKQEYLTSVLEKKPEDITAQQKAQIRKFLIKKRWIRGRGTVRAWLKSGKMLNEMRFKKAAIAMVLIYRTVGRALSQARDSIGVKKNAAEDERKKRDLQFQLALKAAEDLKRLQSQKAEMDAQLRKQAEENARNLADKDTKLAQQEDRMREFMQKLQDSNNKLAELQQKQLKLHQDSKDKDSKTSSQLIALQADKDRASAQVRTLEGQVSAKNEELAAKDKQIAERQSAIDGLKRDIGNLKEQMDQLSESGESAVAQKIKEANEQKDAFNQERERLEGLIKDKESDVAKKNQELAAAESRYNSLREDNEHSRRSNDEKASDYERQLAEKNRIIADLKNEIEALKKRLEETKQQAENAARQAADALKQARQDAKEEANKLERSISDKEQEIARLQNELAVLRASSESNAKSNAEALAQEREESRERIDKMEKAVSEKDLALNQAKRDLALATGKLEAAVASQAELASRMAAQNNEQNEKLQEQQEKQERASRKLDAKLAETQAEVALYKDRLENAQRELKAAQQLNEDNKLNYDRQAKEKETTLQELKAEIRKLQAKYDTLLQSTADKAALLQDQVNSHRNAGRENQARFEKEMWEKNKELGEVKSELDLLKARLEGDRLKAEQDKKIKEDQFNQLKTDTGARLEKYEQELKEKTDEISELKADYKTDKKEWKEKQDRYEKRVTDLEKEIENKQDIINNHQSKLTLQEKNAKQLAEETELANQRKEAKLQQQIDDLKTSEREYDSKMGAITAEKHKAVQDLEAALANIKEKEKRFKENEEKNRLDKDRLEREFVSFKGEIGAANEAKMVALSGQVQTLKTMLEDEKHDKEEAKKREAEYRDRLKEASSSLGEALSELKHIQTTHNVELEKLRLELETAREKHILESSAWKDQADGYERQLIEKSSQINDLKSDLVELADREAVAQNQLKSKSQGAKEELRKLKHQNDEYEAEQKQWLERQSTYEARLAKANVELVEAQAALAEADRKRESSLADLKTELEVLNAQLEEERKASRERDSDLEKESRLHKERFAKELARVTSQHDRDLKQKDALQKNQEESFKYKLQYLELSQKDLKRERKTWQDKEQGTKRQLTQLSAEIRELKAKLHQANELHEAYKSHVDSKEASRSSESSGWDMKKQALISEHQLELKRAQGSQTSRISQLEHELERVKADLDHANSTIQQLNEQIAEDSGSHYEAPKRGRQEEKKAPAKRESTSSTFSATIPVADITISATVPDSEPTQQQSESVDIQVSSSGDEAAF
jgi:myosin heavy subunit